MSVSQSRTTPYLAYCVHIVFVFLCVGLFLFLLNTILLFWLSSMLLARIKAICHLREYSSWIRHLYELYRVRCRTCWCVLYTFVWSASTWVCVHSSMMTKTHFDQIFRPRTLSFASTQFFSCVLCCLWLVFLLFRRLTRWSALLCYSSAVLGLFPMDSNHRHRAYREPFIC